MSLLRNVLIYMGLGPDEDYDDGYLQDGGEGRRADQRRADGRRAEVARIDLTDQADDLPGAIDDGEPDPHAPRERPSWLADQADVGTVAEGRTAERVAPAAVDADVDVTPEPVATGGSTAAPTDGPPAHSADVGAGVKADGSGAVGGPATRTQGSVVGRRAELRSPTGAKRPLRAVPPADLGIQSDLVQPENGLTVRSVPMEAEMVPDTSAADAAPQLRRQVMPRIVSPESFGDAKSVADDFMRSVPIVLNLQRVERDLARRLIDFASGICYALTGSMEKLAPQVFLLIPPGVEVAEVDRRRIAQRGYEG